MNKFSILIWAILLFKTTTFMHAQQADSTDSTQNLTTFSGSVGITNNGFSIVPTFSLNSPAVIMNFAWRKKRLSFEPDFRLVPDASKGGLLFWLRYKLVDKEKFSLRVGAHPAFSLVRKTVIDNGQSLNITEMLRFAAWEVVPTYRINPNWSVGAVYLQGNGLQNHGPQTTHVVFLNTVISNIKLGDDFRLQLIPVVYFLNLDGYKGYYTTGTVALSHKKLPFNVQYTFNKTFEANIPNNRDFMWNVMVNYFINKKYKKVKG
jgi:hypothetical protein